MTILTGRFQRFLGWTENLDVYIAAILATVVAALDAFDIVNPKAVGALTLAVLALLALSLLASRRANAELKNAVVSLTSSVTALQVKRCTAADVLLRSYPDVEQRIRRAKRVRLVGTTLTPTAARYLSAFQELLRNGGTLEVVVSEPTRDVLAMQRFRSSSTRDPDALKGIVEGNLAMLRSLRTVGGSRLDLRGVPFLVSYSLMIIEMRSSADGEAVAYVKLLPFRRPDSDAPTFAVSSAADAQWFMLFEEQFNALKTSSSAL